RRLAVAAAQLFRAGRDDPAASALRRHRVLFAGAVLGALPLRDPGDLRHHHRIAGGDLGRVLDDAPGRPARPAAAHGNPSHLGHRLRPDLRADDEHRDAGGRRAIVLIFHTSGALAAAYGIAVSGVMLIDTFNASIVAARQWKWGVQRAA